MSHIVQIQTEVRDLAAIRAACDRLRLPQPAFGETQLFSGSKTGWAVQLPEWRYPVVCDIATGRVDFDNYGGRWGTQKQLDRLLQSYAVEKAKIEARKRGNVAIEQALPDGSIKLTINVGGAT